MAIDPLLARVPVPGWLWVVILIGGAIAFIVDRFIDRRRDDD